MSSPLKSIESPEDILDLLNEKLVTGKCVCCGSDAKHNVIWGIQY